MNNKHKYAKNFFERSRACKEAAGHICKECKIVRGTELVSWSGRIWKVYMVAAHVDHDPYNPHARLVCVCPRCHWKFYRKQGQPAVWVIERMKHRRLLGLPLTARG